MRKQSHLLAGALCALLLATPLGAQDYLYKPAPAESDAAPNGAEGVLVREVTVQKGDTLYHLSRQFSGRGGYYPQILLFNELKDPNLIYPGAVLRIPVSRKGLSAVETTPGKKVKSAAKKQRHASRASKSAPVSRAAAAPARKPVVQATAATAPAAAPTHNERAPYARIQALLKRGDCQAALPLLDNFIANNPDAPQTPEATLSRAECYLKIASQ